MTPLLKVPSLVAAVVAAAVLCGTADARDVHYSTASTVSCLRAAGTFANPSTTLVWPNVKTVDVDLRSHDLLIGFGDARKLADGTGGIAYGNAAFYSTNGPLTKTETTLVESCLRGDLAAARASVPVGKLQPFPAPLVSGFMQGCSPKAGRPACLCMIDQAQRRFDLSTFEMISVAMEDGPAGYAYGPIGQRLVQICR